MSPSPPQAHDRSDSNRVRRARALLRDLGSQLRRGSESEAARSPSAGQLPTGLPEIDRLVGGGFPAGRLSEIHGPASSGRTSLALGLLARTTRAGEVAALVDPARALDAASAQVAGVDLSRLLWVHPNDVRQAGRCCEQILQAGGFALVLWDLAHEHDVHHGPRSPGHEISQTVWQKLSRAASASATALVVLTRQRSAGSRADLVLEMQPARPHFSAHRSAHCGETGPTLLEGFEIEARVVRHRTGPDQRAVSVRLAAHRQRGAA